MGYVQELPHVLKSPWSRCSAGGYEAVASVQARNSQLLQQLGSGGGASETSCGKRVREKALRVRGDPRDPDETFTDANICILYVHTAQSYKKSII